MTINELSETLWQINESCHELQEKGVSFIGLTVVGDTLSGPIFGDPRVIISALLEALRDAANQIPPEELASIFEAFNASMDTEKQIPALH